jgi:hypothetical protein
VIDAADSDGGWGDFGDASGPFEPDADMEPESSGTIEDVNHVKSISKCANEEIEMEEELPRSTDKARITTRKRKRKAT